MKEKKRIVEKTERAKNIAPYICVFSIAPNSDVGSQMSSQMFFILAISLGVSFYRINLTVFFPFDRIFQSQRGNFSRNAVKYPASLHEQGTIL